MRVGERAILEKEMKRTKDRNGYIDEGEGKSRQESCRKRLGGTKKNSLQPSGGRKKEMNPRVTESASGSSSNDGLTRVRVKSRYFSCGIEKIPARVLGGESEGTQKKAVMMGASSLTTTVNCKQSDKDGKFNSRAERTSKVETSRERASPFERQAEEYGEGEKMPIGQTRKRIPSINSITCRA